MRHQAATRRGSAQFKSHTHQPVDNRPLAAAGKSTRWEVNMHHPKVGPPAEARAISNARLTCNNRQGASHCAAGLVKNPVLKSDLVRRRNEIPRGYADRRAALHDREQSGVSQPGGIGCKEVSHRLVAARPNEGRRCGTGHFRDNKRKVERSPTSLASTNRQEARPRV